MHIVLHNIACYDLAVGACSQSVDLVIVVIVYKVKMDKIYETDDINDIGVRYVCDNSQCGVLDRK